MQTLTKDISYAPSARTKSGRALIRTMETLSGRHKLLRMARGYETETATGADFFRVMSEKYRLKLDVLAGSLENIPRSGPLILIANHPYGILDGLVLGDILAQRRGDFRLLAHSVFRQSDALRDVILPVNFDGTKDGVRQNLHTRHQSMTYLENGGAIGIFPGGTVSTAVKPFAQPMDPRWRPFTAKLVARTGATVVPIYFEGANSRLFQIASHLHATLRMSLLINEFRRARKTPVRLVVGQALDRGALDACSRDPRAMMDFLRESTYRLAPNPLQNYGYGFEFEANHR